MLMPSLDLGTAALFALGACIAGWHLRWMRRLSALESSPDRDGSSARRPVKCSVVVAARDEEARLGETVRRLLAHRSVELEWIVVDDRSRDRTGEILDGSSDEDSRLKVIHLRELPEGWLGKCHACHVGARSATGEWILFTDADCWANQDVLRRALETAEREQVEHFTLTSGLAVPNPGLRAGSLLFHLGIANWISGVNRDQPNAHVGIGAFQLVLMVVVILGAGWGTGVGLAAALSPFCLSLPAAVLARRLGWAWWNALGVPFALPNFLCALVNSTHMTVRHGGIRWRDTFYPLEALRARGVR